MRSLTPRLTDELAAHVAGNGYGEDVWRAPAFKIGSYRELVEHVAKLSYRNPTQLLFFRGQEKDYQSRAQGSTLYPAIYRGDNLPSAELKVRLDRLESAGDSLVDLFNKHEVDGVRDVSRKIYVRWSILQHYEVVPTPLLDITHSLRVACSFAHLPGASNVGYVFVLGLPYPTNRISINSEEEIVNIRLLSICPPTALRPYFQEGYMAGTPDITSTFESKTELDFRNRLIAKFEIPPARTFWSSGFSRIPKRELFPSGDRVYELCQEISSHITEKEAARGDLGQLLVEWGKLEESLLPYARQLTQKNVSVPEALRILSRQGFIESDVVHELDHVRRIRNIAAHTPAAADKSDVAKALAYLQHSGKMIERKLASLF